MRIYKLEAVQGALRQHGAAGGTIVGVSHTEQWRRVVSGTIYFAVLKWEHADQIVAGNDVAGLIHALFVQPIFDTIEAAGGLWL